ncbi:ATP-binding protein [Rhodococcus sp. BP-316]|uniref:ATP-binding protein n=1 Tax=Rhodococcus sp. BP-316 TaxID=2739445 RepID=UPI001C9B7989|nr:ATP-binding protein [Rhodococcus sp. BP-316]MBY6682320.1 ATP-binding protein [Rhodococcus sp. BP-316]
MNGKHTAQPETELPVVVALRSLSVFSASQAGAYREHFAATGSVMGPDVETKLGRYLRKWATEGLSGTVILTGNAGTGKTAAAEVYCSSVGAPLPRDDGNHEISPAKWVTKDLSGIALESERVEVLSTAITAENRQTLICANEGILRDTFERLTIEGAVETLETALREGAAESPQLTIINVNRQRPTSTDLWNQILDYVTQERLWRGCSGCPYDDGGCSMRANVDKLRLDEVRNQMRTLFRLGTGEAVPTLREVLAILAWSIVGDRTCLEVRRNHRDRGASGATATDGYFTRVVGGGLDASVIERSPLLTGIRRSGLGHVSDLEVDGWLRDTSGSSLRVRSIAGDPAVTDASGADGLVSGLTGSKSPLDRVRTAQGDMTFHALGEMVSTSEDTVKVEDGLDALVRGNITNAPAETLWRQRVYFEASQELGGQEATARRLLDYKYTAELAVLAHSVSVGVDHALELNKIVSGLNFLVTGFSSPNEGLIIPDPACLFGRDPGSFRLASPSLVHGQIRIDALRLRVPDRGLVEEVLDVDHVDIELMASGGTDLSLRIGPKMYEAIREAAEFQGPVGQGVAEMNDLRGFYGRLAGSMPELAAIRIADPKSNPPSLVTVTLPHFVEIRGS